MTFPDLSFLFSPPAGLTLATILLISFILGLLHGATPDEHTWPITFSYAIGSYSTKGGMKTGFIFSLGFTMQRAFLTTLGFIGLAAFYITYNLNGPVYVIVGVAMFVAGSYVLKGKYLHIPFDCLFCREHHTSQAKRIQPHESLGNVPSRLALVHGLIAGFGFGAYASIITFILAPQVHSLIYAPLVGVFFGLGTMVMQIVFGAVFARLVGAKKLGEDAIKYLGRSTAGRTLYYGGILFALIGALVVAFPLLNSIAISTGNPIPNLDSVGVSTILVLGTVGVIGIGSMLKGYRELVRVSGQHEEEISKTRLP
jgi:ABC-type nickel/cobalt efflux system permease component RcnA